MQTGSLVNLLTAQSTKNQPEPAVGVGATQSGPVDPPGGQPEPAVGATLLGWWRWVRKNAEPAVGRGATLLGWSDRHAGTISPYRGHRTRQPVADRRAGTISRVGPNAKTLWWKQDNATRTDRNGMSDCQTYSYAPNPDAGEYQFTLRKNGRWVEVGRSSMKNGRYLSIGRRDEHYDYSF